MTSFWYYSKTGCDGMRMCCERRQWLGEEMYGVWSGGCQRKLGERLWKKTVRHVNWTRRMSWIIVD